jgi:hypothetical protein
MNERTRRTGGACNNNQYIQDLSKPPILKLPGHPAPCGEVLPDEWTKTLPVSYALPRRRCAQCPSG